MIQGKIWGQTQLVFSENNVEIHRIQVRKGGYCSRHKHVAKYNLFFVESGKLRVTIMRGKQVRPTDAIVLSKGMSTLIHPGELHMFEAVSDCVAYEIYWTTLDPNDIRRYSEGGLKTVR